MTALLQAEQLSDVGLWRDYMGTRAGQRIKVLISYSDTSATVTQRNVHIALRVPKGVQIAGIARLTNSLHPRGTLVDTQALTRRSAAIGDYMPGANGYVTLVLKMPSSKQLRCGTTPIALHLAEQSKSARGTALLSLHVLNACPTNTTPVPTPVG